MPTTEAMLLETGALHAWSLFVIGVMYVCSCVDMVRTRSDEGVLRSPHRVNYKPHSRRQTSRTCLGTQRLDRVTSLASRNLILVRRRCMHVHKLYSFGFLTVWVFSSRYRHLFAERLGFWRFGSVMRSKVQCFPRLPVSEHRSPVEDVFA